MLLMFTFSSSWLQAQPKSGNAEFEAPKVDLPFYVFQDVGVLPYIPSAHMGKYKSMFVKLDHTENVHAGQTCIRLMYTGVGDWFGLGFVDPANDWGDKPGGYNISGAKTFSFWAKASISELKVSAGLGIIDDESKPYRDSALKIEEIILTEKWKKYTFDISDLDLSCIRSGFVIYGTGQGKPLTIYIDDIVFE